LQKERRIDLEVRLDGHLGVLVTPGRLGQVIDNLLANAFAVSPAGATVTLSARLLEGSVELHVVDEGPGMSEVERALAFDRFWRGGDDHEGLGLAIVQRLVSADEGTVELQDDPAGGLDAVVRVPAALMKNAQNPARDLSVDRA
jgi:two-component system OmpR family sensor kinase